MKSKFQLFVGECLIETVMDAVGGELNLFQLFVG